MNTNEYSKMLDIQLVMTFEREYLLFQKSPEWVKAKNVLDIGCGNGAYLSRLQMQNPEKSYTGIDLNSELIDLAAAKYPSIRFLSGSFSEVIKEKFDIIHIRLVLNTVSDRSSFFRNLRALCHDNTLIVITDTEDSHFLIEPPLPTFFKKLQNVRKTASGNGASRILRKSIPQEMNQADFILLNDSDYAVSNRQTGNQLMKEYMQVTSNMIGQMEDESEIENELSQWESNNQAKASFGLFTQNYKIGALCNIH